MGATWTKEHIDGLLKQRPIVARVQFSTSNKLAQVDVFHRRDAINPIGPALETVGWYKAGSPQAVPDNALAVTYRNDDVSPEKHQQTRGIILRTISGVAARPPFVWTPEVKALVADEWKAGKSFKAIAEQIGATRAMVASFIRRHGLLRKHQPKDDRPSREEIRVMVAATLGLDAFDDKGTLCRAGLYLVGALYNAPRYKHVPDFTGLTAEECSAFEYRARSCEIVNDIGVHAGPWGLEEKDAQAAAIYFALDCMVVEGSIISTGTGEARTFRLPGG